AILAVVACLSSSITASAQAVPTAAQTLHVSAFGGLTGTYTGIAGGRNLGITAGVDLGIRPVFAFYPSLELRGTYPIATGSIDSQRNILGGINLARSYGRLHPYGDLLFGRGQINYGAGRVTPDRTAYYIQSFSNVLSPGLGLDLDLSDHLAVKFDAQLQRYSSPVTTSGHLYAKPLTLGVTYRFGFNHRPRRDR
ncbi:MAG: porin family protein, partial [Acidobacteria bacterium]|nr:porin family protein [Acidobacteriota bacterium]